MMGWAGQGKTLYNGENIYKPNFLKHHCHSFMPRVCGSCVSPRSERPILGSCRSPALILLGAGLSSSGSPREGRDLWEEACGWVSFVDA